MVPCRKRPPRTRANYDPVPNETGPKVRDEVCGAITYEGRLVADEEGQRVDPRFGTYDFATGRGAQEGPPLGR